MKKLICKLFGHKYILKPKPDILSNTRVCSRCGKRQRRINSPSLHTIDEWVDECDFIYHTHMVETNKSSYNFECDKSINFSDTFIMELLQTRKLEENLAQDVEECVNKLVSSSINNEITIDINEIRKLPNHSVTDPEIIRQISLYGLKHPNEYDIYDKIKQGYDVFGLYPTTLYPTTIKPFIPEIKN